MDNTTNNRHKNTIRTAIYSNKKIIASITTAKTLTHGKVTAKAV